MNQYSYVGNNPINMSDYTGNLCNSNFALVLGAALGYSLFGQIGLLAGPGIGTYANYTGAGKSCGPNLGDPVFEMALLVIAFNSNYSPEEKSAFFLWRFIENQRIRGAALTEVDKRAQVHDRSNEGSDFTSRESIPGNMRFIDGTTSQFIGRGILGPIPESYMLKKTRKREYNALYKKDMLGRRTSGAYGDLTPMAAEINTAGTIIGDWGATMLGTGIFGTANIVNKIVETGEAFTHPTSKFLGKQSKYMSSHLGINAHWTNGGAFIKFKPPTIKIKFPSLCRNCLL
jgi:hypothetical protein